MGSHVPRDVLGRGKDRNIAADSVNITSGGIYFKHSKGGQEKAFNYVKGVDMLNNAIVRSWCVCVRERERWGAGGIRTGQGFLDKVCHKVGASKQLFLISFTFQARDC